MHVFSRFSINFENKVARSYLSFEDTQNGNDQYDLTMIDVEVRDLSNVWIPKNKWD